VEFEYGLYREDALIDKGSSVWEERLPLTRRFPVLADAAAPVTFGMYFEAARTFLEKEEISRCMAAVSQKAGSVKGPLHIRNVRICLKKHGEFYHPAKVSLIGNRWVEPFVLNVAVSDFGKRILKRETRSLKRLQGLFPRPFVPRVHASGTVSTKAGEYGMLLGDWFEGYHEFHLYRDDQTHREGVCVWDDTRGAHLLSKKWEPTLYQNIAYILTFYYNPVTFEEVHPWHHAAGDFVLKVDTKRLQVRLVTVRDYRPMFHPLSDQEEKKATSQAVLDALLLFFLNLSCRIRLDRESGTGEWVWADGECVGPALVGFFLALGEKAPLSFLPAPLVDCFAAYMGAMSRKDVFELLTALVIHRCRIKDEAAFVLKHLPAHADELVSAFTSLMRTGEKNGNTRVPRRPVLS